MQIVQAILVEKTINFLDSLMARGRVKINGEYVDKPIFKTLIKDSTIRKYLYLEDEVGQIEDAHIISSSGEVLIAKPYDIKKGEDGLVMVFEIKLEVKEPDEEEKNED